MSPVDDATYPSQTSKKATYSLVGLKFLELCLIICCIGLIDDPATHSHFRVFITPRVVALSYVTFGCLLIYTSIHLIMTMFGDATPWKTATVWSFIGFFLILSSTALLFRDWSNTKEKNYWEPNTTRLDLVLATAWVSLIAALVYLIDLLLTIRFGSRGDLD